MSELKEIKRPVSKYGKPTSKLCPSCNGTMVYEMVACPDGKLGCCVCHYGYICNSCGKQWQ